MELYTAKQQRKKMILDHLLNTYYAAALLQEAAEKNGITLKLRKKK